MDDNNDNNNNNLTPYNIEAQLSLQLRRALAPYCDRHGLYQPRRQSEVQPDTPVLYAVQLFERALKQPAVAYPLERLIRLVEAYAPPENATRLSCIVSSTATSTEPLVHYKIDIYYF